MRKIFISIIEFYQKHISVWLQSKNVNCKFYPSCSEYTKQAIEKYGVIKGTILGIKRILRCNPFSKGGYDPLKWDGGDYNVSIFCKHFWLYTKYY